MQGSAALLHLTSQFCRQIYQSRIHWQLCLENPLQLSYMLATDLRQDSQKEHCMI